MNTYFKFIEGFVANVHIYIYVRVLFLYIYSTYPDTSKLRSLFAKTETRRWQELVLKFDSLGNIT